MHMLKMSLYFAAFNLEDELPDYDLDSEDEAFLEHFNKGRSKVIFHHILLETIVQSYAL